MEKIKICTSEAYSVSVGSGSLSESADEIKSAVKGRKALIISDSNVYPLFGEKTEKIIASCGLEVYSFIFPAGEASKNPRVLSEIWECAAKNRLSRADALIALGGGVAGDLTGFAAGTFLRGIKYINIPTSLLAMVDACIGGKTAVNLSEGKNLAGIFYQPAAVICDTDALSSLPEKNFSEGMAEIIKYGMICSPKLLAALKKGFNAEKIIAECVKIKGKFVELDERDTGLRQLLNFGHTAGHAIEKLSGFSVSHGIAVAEGMALITRAAVNAGLCDKNTENIFTELLNKYSIPRSCAYSANDIAQAAMNDKKMKNGEINLIIPKKAGECILFPIPAVRLAEFLSGAEK